MKLWLLRPRLLSAKRAAESEECEDVEWPWDPWYDKAFGFVVRSETEEDARALAAKECGDEGEHGHLPLT